MPYVKVSGTWKPVKALYRKVSGSWKSSFIQGGFVDKTFAEYDKIESNVHFYRGVATQSDGKTILLGMSTWGGRRVGQVVRLNSDGSLDTAFSDNVGIGINLSSGYPKGVMIQSDGKILIFGWFSAWNSTATNNVVRLNSDGTRDTSFNPNLPVLTAATIGFEIEFVAFPQSDGKVLVSYHYYDPEFNEVTRTVRLNSNGTLDSSFNTNVGTGANGTVNSIAIQTNGQILLGGFYQSWNGASVSNIVRLNSDGTRDTSFTNNTGSAANDSVSSIAIQSTGQIILAGSFTTWNGATVNRIVRLNTNGTRDTAFNTNTGTASPSSISFMQIQPDDKVVLSGFIPTWNGTTVNNIVRLNSDGTRDTVFTTNAGSAASQDSGVSLAVESSGKIIIANITTWNNSTTIGHIRLNTDGSIDSSYGAGYYSYAASQTVNASKTQTDGKVVVVGQFISWDGVTVNRIVRLNPDGSRDTTFNANTGTAANATIKCIAIQSNGQILLGGDFTTWNGTTVNRIVRLNSDGTRDTTFTSNVGSAANQEISAIAVQSNGQILLGGRFTTWKGVFTIRLVRLNSNGTLDTGFDDQSGISANDEIAAIAVQTNGQIVLGGYFDTFDNAAASYVVRLNSNGARDTAFSSNTANSLDGPVLSIALQSDSKIVLGGSFTTWNGSAANNIVVLNTNGTRSTFSSGVSSEFGAINSIAIQSNGQIVLGGTFTAWSGTAANRIIRVSSSGVLESAFNANVGTGPNEGILHVDVTPNGDIVASGFFTVFNGSARNRIVKLGGEPAL